MELAETIQPWAASAGPIMPPPPNEPSALLELPQELRNMIYDFAMHPKTSKTRGSRIRVSLHPASEMGYIYNARIPYLIPGEVHWYKLKRKLLGLVQTNRQLRTEFLSTFEECMEYTVAMHDLFDWLTKVVLPAREAKIPVGKITHVWTNFDEVTSMLDTILLLVQHHDLDISYRGILNPIRYFVHDMINTPALRDDVRDSVVEIEIWVGSRQIFDVSAEPEEIFDDGFDGEEDFEDSFDRCQSDSESGSSNVTDSKDEILKHWGSTCVAIFVKPEHAEAWMALHNGPAFNQEYSRSLQQWCQNMGIDGGVLILADDAKSRQAFEPEEVVLVTPNS